MNTPLPPPASVLSGPEPDLRARAQAMLQPGAPVSAVPDSAQALRVLFDLASSSETAADALALLHELQVHQVELDLQTQALHDARQDQELASAENDHVHDNAPSARAELDLVGRVLALNATAALYWAPGVAAGLLGRPFSACLSESSRLVFERLCQAAPVQGLAASGVLSLQAQAGVTQTICGSVKRHPARPVFLFDWLAMPAA